MGLRRPASLAEADLAPSRAIIDIGSNTVRLVVYGGPARAPAVLHNEKVTARLGRNLAETGRLSASGVTTALAALTRYRLLIDLMKVPTTDVVATAAARDAEDGADFLKAVRTLGFRPRLLSGEEEAETSGIGVLGAFPLAHGLVADLGGGSLELIDIAPGACRHGVSLPLGTLRLAAARSKGPRGFVRHVVKAIAKAGYSAEPGSDLYLVGGSFRAFARHAMGRTGWPFDDPHGLVLNAETAGKLATALARRKPEALAPLPGVSASRLASLPDTGALLAALIEVLAPARLVFSSWGLREGLLHASLSPRDRAIDPLIAGVRAFTSHYGASPEAAEAIARWIAPALDHAGDPPRARLDLVAAYFALASARVEPNLRADETLGWVMRKRLVGIDTADRAALAATMVGNAGRLAIPAALRPLADDTALRGGLARGLAIRLVRRLSGGAPGALAGSRLERADGRLMLHCDPALAALVGDSTRRDLRALAEQLGLEPRIAL